MLGLSLFENAQLALALADDKVPNEAAVALSPVVGWLMLASAICVVLVFLLQSDPWRRWWLRVEDPRSIAMFRIVFGFFVIANVNDLWEYFTFLFTDEGIFTADIARQVHASNQFRGFGDGYGEDDPWGFFDFEAVIQFLKGPKYSLLYFWDTPTFFWWHLWAFELVAFLFMIGMWTRVTGVLTWFLMNSMFFRNHLFWEGTELVYRVFLVYLLCAKAGHAWSVDNWLRCRKLRKRNRLSERGGPGGGAGVAPSDEHPKGLQAVYRLIPAWPRRLMMLQMCTLMSTTGILKNGSVWGRGDAIYYAWNLDHFYRFYPQQLSQYFGTNLLRVATWVTHWGAEVFFSFVIVGLIARWAIADGTPPLHGWRKWGVRAAWATLILLSAAMIHVVWPVHYVPPISPWLWNAAWVALLAAVWWLWWRTGNKPFRIKSILWIRKLDEVHVIDRQWFSTWILGRRVWLAMGVGLMVGINMVMNIGQFQTGILSAMIPFLTGPEWARILRAAGRRLGAWGVPGIPRDVRDGEPPLPTEDASLPHLRRDAARLPQWAMGVTLFIVVGGVVVRALWNPLWGWYWIWITAAAFVAGVAYWRARTARGQQLTVEDPQTGRPRVPWAYGPLGRFLAGGVVVWQLAAVTTWLLPGKDSLKQWRVPARNVFSKWLTVTTTDQGWGMFAPNPPRSNVFLKVLVTDMDGEVWDLRTDVYAPERKPIPWIWNDRLRKMNRRIIGGESGPTEWYRKWHARYHCRNWALEHGGEAPKKVELVKVWYRIPSPELVRDRGYYVPEELLERTGAEEVKYEEFCKNAKVGQLPNWIRERHGLPLLEEGEYRPWLKHRKRKWDRYKARKRGEDKPQKAKLQAAPNDGKAKAAGNAEAPGKAATQGTKK